MNNAIKKGGAVKARASGLFAHAKKLAVAAAAGLAMGSASAQGIPVIDISNLAQALLMVQNMQQQVQQMQQQYQTMTSQLQALTGNRGLGQILNDPRLVSYLPPDWQSVYQQVSNGQLPSITSTLQAIQSAEGMVGGTAGQQRYNTTLASNKAMAMQAFAATNQRLQNIQALMRQSDYTQDPAAKADLQNRLNAEVAMVNNEQTRMQLMGKLADVEEKLADHQTQTQWQNQFLGTK